MRRSTYADMDSADPPLWVLGSMAPNGNDVRIHVRSANYLGSPEWSPDSRYIAFSEDRDGRGARIFAVELESGQVARLVPEIAGSQRYSDGEVSWAQELR